MAIALIAAVPATVGALTGLYIARMMRTPSGKSIGRQVEDVNHTTRSNWHTLDAVRRVAGVERPELSRLEDALVDELRGSRET